MISLRKIKKDVKKVKRIVNNIDKLGNQVDDIVSYKSLNSIKGIKRTIKQLKNDIS